MVDHTHTTTVSHERVMIIKGWLGIYFGFESRYIYETIKILIVEFETHKKIFLKNEISQTKKKNTTCINDSETFAETLMLEDI